MLILQLLLLPLPYYVTYYALHSLAPAHITLSYYAAVAFTTSPFAYTLPFALQYSYARAPLSHLCVELAPILDAKLATDRF